MRHICVDRRLVIDVQRRAGARVHMAVQLTSAYEMKVREYNDPLNDDDSLLEEIAGHVAVLEMELRRML